CEDERVGRFMRRTIFDEIVPTVDVPGTDRFASDVMDRFANPFIRHALLDITLIGGAKLAARVVPSIVAYHARTGRAPASLAFAVAAYLAFTRGEMHAAREAAGLATPEDHKAAMLRAVWTTVDMTSDASITTFALEACSEKRLWGDLTALN